MTNYVEFTHSRGETSAIYYAQKGLEFLHGVGSKDFTLNARRSANQIDEGVYSFILEGEGSDGCFVFSNGILQATASIWTLEELKVSTFFKGTKDEIVEKTVMYDMFRSKNGGFVLRANFAHLNARRHPPFISGTGLAWREITELGFKRLQIKPVPR